MADNSTPDTPWESISKKQGTGKDFSIEILGAAKLPDSTEKGNYIIPIEQIGLECGGISIIEGTCSSAASTKDKIVTLSDYPLSLTPKEFTVTFTNGNTYGDVIATPVTYPTLKIYNSNNVLLDTLPVADSCGHYAGKNCWMSGDSITFRIVNNRASIQNSSIRQYDPDNNGYIIFADGHYGYNISQAELKFENNHNIPRKTPKDITSYITDGSLWKRLNGTDGYALFDDIYVGDYIRMSRPITVQDSYDGTVGSQYVTIAGINTLQGNGDNISMNYNHLVMVPGQGFGGIQHFGRRRMNPTSTTAGGYVSSEMHTTHIGAVANAGDVNGNINQQLYAEFGSHLKTIKELLTNAVNNSGVNRFGSASGCSSNWGWYSCQAVLMSEIECYGSTVWSSSGYDTGVANHWLPLFQYSNNARNDRTAYYWLKDVASSVYFCNSYSNGYSYYNGAGNDYNYVRPRFVIA